MKELVELAHRLGASAVGIMEAGKVPLKDSLARLCLENRCENYGLSYSCPPHVKGPDAFRELQKTFRHAVIIRIDIPQSVMFSNEKDDVLGLVHEIVSALELAALEAGYPLSRAFAGGSCKKIFCLEHPRCRRLFEDGECRHPHRARPSMSGFGIHVTEMLKRAGCAVEPAMEQPPTDQEPMTWVAGLVMLG